MKVDVQLFDLHNTQVSTTRYDKHLCATLLSMQSNDMQIGSQQAGEQPATVENKPHQCVGRVSTDSTTNTQQSQLHSLRMSSRQEHSQVQTAAERKQA